MENKFEQLSENEIMDIEGGSLVGVWAVVKFVGGVAIGAGVTLGTGVVVAAAVYAVAKTVQWAGDKITSK